MSIVNVLRGLTDFTTDLSDMNDTPDLIGGSGLTKEFEAAEDKAATEALLAALEPFRAKNPTMTLQQLVSFLLVAKEQGLTVSWYAQKAGLAQGVMTRNLFDLGEYNRRKEPGLGLVEQRPDLQDRRAHLTYLTHAGRGVVAAYRRALESFASRK